MVLVTWWRDGAFLCVVGISGIFMDDLVEPSSSSCACEQFLVRGNDFQKRRAEGCRHARRFPNERIRQYT